MTFLKCQEEGSTVIGEHPQCARLQCRLGRIVTGMVVLGCVSSYWVPDMYTRLLGLNWAWAEGEWGL